MGDDGAEIRDLARTFQYDRFLAALLAPREVREAHIVLAAFAGEINRIPRVVSEPMMGAIRLQWWRDQVQALDQAGGPASEGGHQLLGPLGDVVRGHRLPVGLLQGMIDAGEAELDAAPLQSVAEFNSYLTKFEAAQFSLHARVLLDAYGPAEREICEQAGRAYGAARLLAEAEWRRQGAQTFVPAEVFQILPDQNLPVAAARDFFGPVALEGIQFVRDAFSSADPKMRCVLRPLAIVEPSLAASQQGTSGGAEHVLSNFRRARLLLWSHMFGRI